MDDMAIAGSHLCWSMPVGRWAVIEFSESGRRAGLKVPRKQRPRGRLWLNDGSCIRLRPQHRNHVWSYDFVEAQTHDGRKLRLMTLIDEFTRNAWPSAWLVISTVLARRWPT